MKDFTQKFEEREKQNKFLNILAGLYLVTCFIFLRFVFNWMGGLVMWMSIYLFGLPLIFIGFPYVGLVMFGVKSMRRILFGFLASLTPLLYLLPAFTTFPLQVQTDAAGNMATISPALSMAIVISALLFFSMSTVSFYYCRKVYQMRE